YTEVASIILDGEIYAAFDDFIASGRTAELTATKAHGHRLAAAVLPAHDYIRAQRIRRIIVARFEELAGHYDALIAPTLGMVASGLTEDLPYMLPGAFGRPLNFAGVLAGSPSISVYNGLGRDELPTGLHFAGARLQENSILDAAREYEGRTEWTHRRPDIDAICRPAHGSPRGDPDEPAAGRESGLAS